MRTCWSVVLGLISAALLLPQPGTARTTSVTSHHATAAHTPKPSAQAHRKATVRTKAAAARIDTTKRSSVQGVRSNGAPKPPRTTIPHAPVPAALASRPLIVIDPGHGGRDSGAVGVSGTLEKTVTLAAALELRRALEATGRYRVALTRSRDRTVSLADRLDFAREHDADLLIAIHADASTDRKARGASVYASSNNSTMHLPANRGSSRRIAQALTGVEPEPEASSAWLQHSMIEQLSDDVRMVMAPARSAHLYVLGARTIPSVLLEMGFLSNRQDESLIKSTAHRQILVQAIRDAIDDYFAAIRTQASRT
jgi:N-acetylmuramoyl-L-alanine amidase